MVNLDNLETRFLITSKSCPIPTQRDLILWAWETLKPMIGEHIERNYVERKEVQKILKEAMKKL